MVQEIAELLIWRRAEHNTLLSWLSALPDSAVGKVLGMQRKGQLTPSTSSENASRLLSAMGKRSQSPPSTRRTVGHLADALSERELEVLRLLADGLESNEIAVRLMIAVDTARKHIKNIYSKLDVQPLGSHQAR